MAEEQASKYWLDLVVDKAIRQYPKGEIITASGHAPSGQYHVGHLRELMTPSLIAWAIQQSGRKARHIDFIDDFDPLRKIPANVPQAFEQHLGKPLFIVPDPYKCGHESYAEHFIEELYESLDKLGIKPDIVRSHKEYQAGKFIQPIETALGALTKVNQIIEEVTGRQLPKDWVPIQLLSDDQRLDEWRYKGWDKGKQVIIYTDDSGKESELAYTKGRVKLNWRLDWPARWGIWNVQVEPFGRDHASKGGSYDTGLELAKQIFKNKPPLPLPFDFINLTGHTKKMSASAGTGVTPKDVLEIMPPEILRYFIAKARPAKPLNFDTELGVLRLWEEYKEVELDKKHEYGSALRVANAFSKGKVTSDVPFDHLVSVYQAAQGDRKKIDQLLERSGYQKSVQNQAKLIEQEIEYVKNWLNKYAPDSVKFSLQEKLPKVELTEAQKQFLANLASKLTKDLDPEQMHQTIYSAKDEAKLEPKDAFTAIYRVLFGKDSGPKAGWFLSTLDRDWLIKRLRQEL